MTRTKNKLIILESPFHNLNPGIKAGNIEYAKTCMLSCLTHHESPFASHLLYTQVTDDNIPAQRTLGIDAGLDWGKAAELTAVYIDRGISKGMLYGIQRAIEDGRPIEYRSLYGSWYKHAGDDVEHDITNLAWIVETLSENEELDIGSKFNIDIRQTVYSNPELLTINL